MKQNIAAKIVADAIAGKDAIPVVVGGRLHVAFPPTIAKLSGAIHYLSQVKECETLRDILLSLGDADLYAHALSHLIAGDDSLFDELKEATFDECVEAIGQIVGLVDLSVFIKAVSLAKGVSALAATPK